VVTYRDAGHPLAPEHAEAVLGAERDEAVHALSVRPTRSAAAGPKVPPGRALRHYRRLPDRPMLRS
jgi:hypothetical protein